MKAIFIEVRGTLFIVFALMVGYIALYELNLLLVGSEAFGGLAALIFLPAFTRLLGFLLIGLWSIPALFGAALFCVDLGLAPSQQVVVSAGLACGAPLALWAIAPFMGVQPHLDNLSAPKLVQLSFVAATGSAIGYNLGLILVGEYQGSYEVFFAIILGDAVGTWTIVYTLKTVLTFAGRCFKKY